MFRKIFNFQSLKIVQTILRTKTRCLDDDFHYYWSDCTRRQTLLVKRIRYARFFEVALGRKKGRWTSDRSRRMMGGQALENQRFSNLGSGLENRLEVAQSNTTVRVPDPYPTRHSYANLSAAASRNWITNVPNERNISSEKIFCGNKLWKNVKKSITTLMNSQVEAY